ncbi:MAG: hypothetical protein J3K34DRAFT_518672 [Monoraphidium minutum]|nr:MAG: hypothetical protein J3K34DRAFT_518672 [Monoraphidium minutum]
MGCCQSVPTVTVDVPRNVSTTDHQIIRDTTIADGCKLRPFTAACPASYPFAWHPVVEARPAYLFAAAFEGVGGAAAARHCRERAHAELAAALARGLDPEAALRAMWRELDRSFLAGPAPDAVKASVGAIGSAVYVDTRSGACYASRLGAPAPFVGRSKGAFSRVRVEVAPLAGREAHSSTYGDMVRRQAAAPAGGGGQQAGGAPRERAARGLDQSLPYMAPGAQLAAPHQQQMRGGVDGDAARWQACALPDELQPGSAGTAVPTHCVGCGYGKSAKLLAVWQRGRRDAQGARAGPDVLPRLPFFTAECEVSVERLSPSDEMVVLPSAGLGRLVSPGEAALMAHTFGAARLAALRDAYSEGPPRADGARLRDGNVACGVVHRAVDKALAAHSRAYRRRADNATLGALPLAVDLAALAPPPGRGAEQGEAARPALPAWYPAGGLTRADVLGGELGVVLLALDWPGSREAVPRSPAVRGALAATPPAGAGARTAPSPGRPPRRAPCGRALHGWELVRLAAKFGGARRRQLLEAWWGAVDGAVRQAEEAARVAEVAAWRTLGQAVQVTRCGEVYDTPDTTPRQLAPRSPARPPSSARSVSAAAKLRGNRPGQSAPGSAAASPAKPPLVMSPDGSAWTGGGGGGAPASGATSPKSWGAPAAAGGAGAGQQARSFQQTPPRARPPRAAGASPSPAQSVASVGPAASGASSATKISLRRRDDRGTPAAAGGR